MESRMLVLLLSAFVLGQSARAADPLFFESFSSGLDKWVASSDPKFSGKLEAATPPGFTDDQAAKVTEKARHYGLSRVVDKPIDPADGLVLQYEVKLADGLTCGGAYLKFLTASDEFDASGLVDNTPYVVMFGPDKCGSTNKVHLILQHRSPSGAIEEKHLKTPPMVPLDSDTHVFTAILQPSDNTYEVLVDGESKKSGSLFEDFEPPFNPPEEIDDPEDKKPEDWVEQAKIADPDAVKPDDWDEDAPREVEDADAEKPEGWLDDEPEEVDDPEAEKPDDWDDEEDGEWEPPRITNPKCTEGPGCGEWKRPTIPNPAYKGKWTAPLIDNPDYKGPWKPRTIANPDYFLDEEPLKNIGNIGGVAIEIWTMDDNYYFDNILIASNAAAAEEARQTYWQPKKAVEEEVKAKEEEEAEKKAAAGADAKSIGEYITGLFDLPGLSALRGPLAPALEFIEENDWAAYAAAAILSSVPLFLVFSVLAPKSKVKKTATATVKEVKKQDKPTPDDTPAAAANSEIVDDEDEEDEKKGVRRRARRD